METKVYKLVSVNSAGSLVSFNNPNSKDIDCVEYKIGEFVYPKLEGSKLFAFSEKQNVVDFLNSIGYSVFSPYPKLFIAQAEDVEPGKYISYDIVEFWRNPDLVIGGGKAPEGTLYCGSIKLLEEVKY